MKNIYKLMSFVLCLIIVFSIMIIPVNAVEITDSEENISSDNDGSNNESTDDLLPVERWMMAPPSTVLSRTNSNDDSQSVAPCAEGDRTLSLFGIYYEEISVQTPNGSSVVALSAESDWSDDQKNYSQILYQNNYPNAVLVPGSITASYNCHSYAWYDRSDDNDVWVDDPSVYFSTLDKSYVEVTEPRIGDIVCYINPLGNIAHSGVITDIYEGQSNGLCGISDLLEVESKWGPQGRYVHNGFECPYTVYNPYFPNAMTQTEILNNICNSLKFYRPRTDNSTIIGNGTTTDLQFSKSVCPSDDMSSTYVMYEVNVTNSGYYDFIFESNNVVDSVLYDDGMQEMTFSPYQSRTYKYSYTKYLYAGRYYVKSSYHDATVSGTISLTLGYHNQHVPCASLNALYHGVDCPCGYYYEEAHIWGSSSILDYAECNICGHLKKTGISGPFIPIIKDQIIIDPEEETE